MIRVCSRCVSGPDWPLCMTRYLTSLCCHWQTRTTQWLMPTVFYTDVDGQCDKLVTETITSLPHWPST